MLANHLGVTTRKFGVYLSEQFLNEAYSRVHRVNENTCITGYSNSLIEKWKIKSSENGVSEEAISPLQFRSQQG